jgi:DNA polymerase-3 subunit epsilon
MAEHLSSQTADVRRPEGEREYWALLCRILEDRRIETTEADALVEVATHLGLSNADVASMHKTYLAELVKLARADGRVTEAERCEIQTVASLLGLGMVSEKQLTGLVDASASDVVTAPIAQSGESWEGKTVCFTGEAQCAIGGIPLSREDAERLAEEHGLLVKQSVSKKLDLLVVSDPNTQSGKATKAKQLNVRIIHEPVFWRTLGIRID